MLTRSFASSSPAIEFVVDLWLCLEQVREQVLPAAVRPSRSSIECHIDGWSIVDYSFTLSVPVHLLSFHNDSRQGSALLHSYLPSEHIMYASGHNVCIWTQNVSIWTQSECIWTQNVCIWTQNVCIWTQNVCIWTQGVCIHLECAPYVVSALPLQPLTVACSPCEPLWLPCDDCTFIYLFIHLQSEPFCLPCEDATFIQLTRGPVARMLG